MSGQDHSGSAGWPIAPREAMKNPLLLPPLALAYVGDSVYEVFVRTRLIESGKVRVGELHKSAVKYVRARAQALALADLHASLTEEEQDVARRGRNGKGHSAPKSSDAAEYAQATAFEALVGYLYLAGRADRLATVLEAAVKYLEEHQ